VEILYRRGLGVGFAWMAPGRKHLQSPAGCEGHLTRQQAARVLGFASEFKVREFERKGLLRSVRGPMRAAFYPRAEVLALKAQLGLSEPDRGSPDAWTDAELLALLGHPKRSGDARTVLDLVLETQINIERAERVHDFWKRHEPSPRIASTSSVQTTMSPFSAEANAPSASHATQERRGEQRRSRDSLIRNLRDPDPRVRELAFAQLKEL
jgi:hypothetical protein